MMVIIIIRLYMLLYIDAFYILQKHTLGRYFGWTFLIFHLKLVPAKTFANSLSYTVGSFLQTVK